MDIATFKSVAEIGISCTITVIFLRQQQKLFEQQDKVISVLAKLEKNLNTDILRGRGLEIVLKFKAKDLRWAVENKIISYIENNHLQANWDIVVQEINTFFEIKMNSFESDIRELIDGNLYTVLYGLFDKELSTKKILIIELLDVLRINGENERDLRIKAIRLVDAYVETMENDLIAKIKEIVAHNR